MRIIFESSETLERKERRKRVPNAFLLFRNAMLKQELQGCITMANLSSIASKRWKEMSEDEKNHWRTLRHEAANGSGEISSFDDQNLSGERNCLDATVK